MQPQFAQPGPPPPDRAGNRILLVLLALGTIALLSLSVVVVLLVRGRADPAAAPPAGATVASPPAASQPAVARPAGSARQQAAKIDSLLDRSVTSRTKLNNAIDRVRRCTGLAGALSDMRAVGDERTKQLADLAAADVSALTDGTTIQATLKSALGYALAADQQFVAWAEPTSGGCGDTAARTAAWEGGQTASKQAQAAKKKFVAAWNPVAVPLGFAQRTTDLI
jgi:hypothetical protein